MGKSAGNFLRLQNLIDMGYDPLAWRMFCLNAHYRAKLNFTRDGLDGAMTSLDRLRKVAYDWGEPSHVDEEYMNKFLETINDDLNMPRALALTWDLVKSDLSNGTKKATILYFDQILGLRLAEWQPTEESIPEQVMELVQERQKARQEKRWMDADALRDEVIASGYEIEDTPQGPRVKRKKLRAEN